MIDSHQFESPRRAFEKMQNDKSLVLIDVREPAEFEEGHAQGANSAPLGSISREKLQNFAPGWNADDQAIYLICESGLRALQAAELLHQQGVRLPVVIEGGTHAWNEAGLPMKRNHSTQISLERQTQIALGITLLAILFKGTLIHPGFYLLTGVIAAGLVITGITAKCSLTYLLAKMPWNQHTSSTA